MTEAEHKAVKHVYRCFVAFLQVMRDAPHPEVLTRSERVRMATGFAIGVALSARLLPCPFRGELAAEMTAFVKDVDRAAKLWAEGRSAV